MNCSIRSNRSLFLLCCALSFCVFGNASTSYAQRYEEVIQSPAHKEFRRLAAKLVIEDGYQISGKPEFRVCNEGHYHVAFPEICDRGGVASFLFQTRLEIESAWKALPQNQQKWWTPYLREIDAELADLDRRTAALSEMQQASELDLSRERIESIWKKGAANYAASKQLELRLPVGGHSAPCAAAGEQVTIKLKITDKETRTVISIEWEDPIPYFDRGGAIARGKYLPMRNRIDNEANIVVAYSSQIVFRYELPDNQWTEIGMIPVTPVPGNNVLILPLRNTLGN